MGLQAAWLLQAYHVDNAMCAWVHRLGHNEPHTGNVSSALKALASFFDVERPTRLVDLEEPDVVP